MNYRFVRILQKDIVTDPKQWKDAGPGKFIKLSNKAKNTYSVLSVIAFSNAGNAEGKFVKKCVKLGKGWFWTSHTILQQLTGHCQKTVQRAIKELEVEGFIGYYPSKRPGQQCFFKIKRIEYNNNRDDAQDSRKKGKYVHDKKPPSRKYVEREEPDLPDIDEIKRLNSPNIVSEEKYETPDMPGNHEEPDLPPLYDEEANKEPGSPGSNNSEIQVEQEAHKPVELQIPYKEGVLFQSGENTHNEEGYLIDQNGEWVIDLPFILAERMMQSEGEEAALKLVAEKNIENHLVPEYRDKLAKLIN